MMNSGAIAILDALGFKGIWDRHRGGVEGVLDKLQRASRYETTLAPISRKLAPGLSEEVRFLSDTIAIGVGAPENGTAEDVGLAALVAVAARVSVLITKMLTDTQGPPLVYRGAVAYGEFVIDGNFLIGPAVDEAASVGRLAQGGFVYLCPSAVARVPIDTHIPPDIERVMMRYRVPLKGGDRFDTYVVPPVVRPSNLKTLIAGIHAAFATGGIDVTIKEQNTLAMLKHVTQWTIDIDTKSADRAHV